MAQTSSRDSRTVEITVELFGRARLEAGRRQVTAAVPVRARAGDLAAALLESCPRLGGVAIREDGSGPLESYTFNLNGARFIGREDVMLESGDTLLLFSSQAGG